MRNLRTRLLLGTGAGATAVLLLAGALLYLLIAGALRAQFDDSLAARARTLAGLVECEGNRPELEFDEADLPEYRPSEHAEYYQVWLNRRKVVARSPSLAGENLPLLDGHIEAPGRKPVMLPDGRAGRALGFTFTPRTERGEDPRPGAEATARPLELTIVVAKGTAPLVSTLGRIRTAMIIVGGLAVLTTIGVLALLVRRGLKPVDLLAARIARIGEEDLASRVETSGIPAELAPVVDRLNDLLGRLDAAFTRERRFTADVAHELRTPLAGVRSSLEVALFRPREPEAYRQAIRDSLEINQQMQQMVENLLSLARADAGQLDITTQDIDLIDMVNECWSPLAQRAGERGLEVSRDLPAPCHVRANPDMLRLVLQNILGNAIAHANDNGWITIRTASDNGRVELKVVNTGSTVPPEETEQVFDRFWRGDQARQARGRHCGLGLALCRTIIQHIGGSIRAASTPDGRFEVTLTFN